MADFFPFPDPAHPHHSASADAGAAGAATSAGPPTRARSRWLRHQVHELLTDDGPRTNSMPGPSLLAVVGHDRRGTETLVSGSCDPHDLVLGFTLPRRFEAVSAHAASIIAAPGAPNQEATVSVAVSRSGDRFSWISTPMGAPVETFRPSGWLVDACLRSVGAATDPAAPHPLELPAALWLDRIMVRLVEASAPLTWPHAVDLCPVPHLWHNDDPVELGVALASTTPSWAETRRGAAAGDPLPLAMKPTWAQWMDDPMFGRWCVGAFPDLDDLRNDVAFLTVNEIAESIEVALETAWSAFAG